MLRKILIVSLLMSTAGATSFAKNEAPGLLPELKINSTNETENQKKALQSEVLITKTENQAIQSLIAIIKKKKGSTVEADLWYRLGELYMRRAKSGRFFDLFRGGDGPVRFAPPEVTSENAIASLKRAIQVYTKIEREFPKFRDMDAVLFNSAFASQQIGLKKNAEALYYKVVTQHSRSPLVPDALLAMGEMAYEEKKFDQALEYFTQIEKFPAARVYSYGMYKGAWTLYNQHKNDDAINKLIQVVKYHDPSKQDAKKVNHNLRSESLRDLAIFFGEARKAEDAYAFFSKIATPDEVGEVMITMGKLFDSHSRHKEMTVFLNDFLKKQPLARQRVKAEMLLIQGNETSRNRPEALRYLISASKTCARGSDWRESNKDVAEAECDYDFAKVNVEMAKKWWELWQKNKNSKDAKEIAEYTQAAFQIHLDREDPTKPDIKSRYAYAELLFQKGDFRNASKQYETAGVNSKDTAIAHDATYSSLVSLEKAMEKKKESTDEDELLRLCQAYLTRHPKGEHLTQVKFKVGFTYYEKDNFTESEKWLRPLASDPKSGPFQRKSEDLILDILNARKDFVAIKAFSGQMLGQTKDESRKGALTKIMQEADYTSIQEFAKTSEKAAAADKLLKFADANKTSPLAKDSLWQALSLYYADGRAIDGADLALKYAKMYPDDKRSLDALKDAAKHFADNGYILPAAETMVMVAKKSPSDNEAYTAASSELFFIEGNVKQAQEALRQQLTDKNEKNHGKIYARLLATMKGQENTAEYSKIQDKIVALGQEPFASEIRITRIEKLLTSGKNTDAFNSAKSLVGSDSGVDDDIRARARLVQAKVLEKEFIETRTKTSLEKLSLILSIKTEKLDKAQTAFLTSAKIAKDPNTKLEALRGLNRIYTNYVDTVGHPILKDEASLAEADKKALSEELAKLTTPILEKKIETDKQLQQLARDSKATGSNDVNFADLPVEATVRPRIQAIPVDQLAQYLPVYSENLFAAARSTVKAGCSYKDTDSALPIADIVTKANGCVTSKNAAMTEKFGQLLVRKDPKSPMGPFYMSLAAEMVGKNEKSAWLVDLALKKSADLPFLLYQKARALYKQQEFAEANAAFLRAGDLGLKAPELTLMHGVVSFAQGDCLTVVDDFTKLDRSWISKFALAPALSECQAQKGEFDRAVAYAEENLKGYQTPVDLWLQIGHIQETYRFDSAKALTAYEGALKASPKSDQKDWIQRKIAFLKGKHTVTASDGDSTGSNPRKLAGSSSDGGSQ